jgi:hypothetical protein
VSAGESAAVSSGSQSAGSSLTASIGASAAQAAPADAAHRSVENAIAGFQRAAGGAVSMVLSPDQNTQLLLHVKMQQGHLQAQVVVQRGDFTTLRGDWGQLQGKLAGQGVRLAPLASSSGNSPTFTGGNHSAAQREREVPSAEMPVPDNTPARASGARSIPTANGREWWA